MADRPAIDHLRVEGSLDAKWADWFEGFVMASRAGGSEGSRDVFVLHDLARSQAKTAPLA